jgi:signal transduction histidine kinase/CheY-like chemotaxis protein/PAS domain-containing protein
MTDREAFRARQLKKEDNRRSIARLSGSGTWSSDVKNGTFYIDDNAAEMLGVVGMRSTIPLSEVVNWLHPDEYEYVHTTFTALLNGDTENMSLRIRLKTGGGVFKWFLTVGTVAETASDGRPSLLLGGFVNIDESTRIQEDLINALTELESKNERIREEADVAMRDMELYRASATELFESSPSFAILLNEKYELISCNPAALDFFGYPNADALRPEFMDCALRIVPQYQLEGQRESIPFKKRLEAVVREGSIAFETELYNKDRERRYVSIVMKQIKLLERSAYVIHMTDVTSLHTVNLIMRRRDVMLTATNRIAEKVNTGTLDSMGKRQFGLETMMPALECQRASIWQRCHEEGGDVWQRIVRYSIEDGFAPDDLRKDSLESIYDGVIALRFASWRAQLNLFGDEIPQELAASGTKAALVVPWFKAGELLAFTVFEKTDAEHRFTSVEVQNAVSAAALVSVAIERDSTVAELVGARDRALASTVAKSEFLSRMSHEIRTPMNAIIGMTTIARRTSDPERISACLDKIDGSSRQLLSIINDVLDMSKIESGKLELTFDEFDFYKMIDHVVNVLQVKFLEMNQVFKLETSAKFTHRVISDELRISQVLINILTNANKFTPRGGEITMNITLEDGNDDEVFVAIAVRDTGIGITPEQRERLFNSFEQADGSITRRFGGTGLGLAISKNIADLLGGSIKVESVPDVGSTFTFRFPVGFGGELDSSSAKALSADIRVLISDDNRDESSSHEQGAALRNWSGRRLLVVEDIEINREIVAALLEDTGIIVDFADNGVNAVEKFKSAEPFDVILMDVQMPVMDGLAATRKIRELGTEYALTVPIIAMTANAFKEDVVRCLEAGMNNHVAKPMEPAALNAVLSKYLD